MPITLFGAWKIPNLSSIKRWYIAYKPQRVGIAARFILAIILSDCTYVIFLLRCNEYILIHDGPMQGTNGKKTDSIWVKLMVLQFGSIRSLFASRCVDISATSQFVLPIFWLFGDDSIQDGFIVIFLALLRSICTYPHEHYIEGQRAINVLILDLSKAFDNLDHNNKP